MKKEYHLTITRKDRIYLVIFVSGLLGWELIKLIIPNPKSALAENQKLENINYSDTLIKAGPDSNSGYKKIKNETTLAHDETESTPISPVPIMTASPQQLMEIGFSKKAAYTIPKYIKAGGQIKNEVSLRKIYGIDTNTLDEILPYIIFPSPPIDSSFLFSERTKSKKSIVIVDLNAATTEELVTLSGIGLKLADRIIKFRTSLGGFLTIDQVKECYGLTEETFEKIKPRITISQPLQTFSINTIDPKTFSHPYLSKKIMWMMENYIKHHGPIENEEELRKVYPPDSNWCEKLLPYVRFD